MTEDQIIKTLNIHVTKRMKVNDAGVCTMIEKNNIDADKNFRQFMSLFGVDYELLGKGGKNGKKLLAQYCNGDPCVINCYIVNGKGGRKDRRFSLSKIKKYAQPNDLLAFTFKKDEKGNTILVVNVTACAKQNRKVG